jgi:hypothetical protein
MKFNLKRLFSLLLLPLSVYATDEYQETPTTSTALVVWNSSLTTENSFSYLSCSSEELSSRIVVPNLINEFIAKRFRPMTDNVLSPMPFQDNPYLYKVTFSNQHKRNQEFYVWLTMHNFPIEGTIPWGFRKEILEQCAATWSEKTMLGSSSSSVSLTPTGMLDETLLSKLADYKLLIEENNWFIDLGNEETFTGNGSNRDLLRRLIQISKSYIRIKLDIDCKSTDFDHYITRIHPVVLAEYCKLNAPKPDRTNGIDSRLDKEFISCGGVVEDTHALDRGSTHFGDAIFAHMKAKALACTHEIFEESVKYMSDFYKLLPRNTPENKNHNHNDLLEYSKGTKSLQEYYLSDDDGLNALRLRDTAWPQYYVPFIKNFNGSADKPSFLMYFGAAHGFDFIKTLLTEPGHLDSTKLVHTIKRFNAERGWVPIDVTPYMSDFESAAGLEQPDHSQILLTSAA